MNKKSLLALAIIVIGVIALGIALKNRSDTQQSTPTETAGLNIVIYTDSGYSPSVLTVKAGATVTFKNESSGALWTASNPHPIHTNLSEFDAKTAVPPAESYSFTFTKVGQWSYHNHLRPSDGGTIFVE